TPPRPSLSPSGPKGSTAKAARREGRHYWMRSARNRPRPTLWCARVWDSAIVDRDYVGSAEPAAADALRRGGRGGKPAQGCRRRSKLKRTNSDLHLCGTSEGGDEIARAIVHCHARGGCAQRARRRVRNRDLRGGRVQ